MKRAVLLSGRRREEKREKENLFKNHRGFQDKEKKDKEKMTRDGKFG